jgi:hypothetical protein
MQPFLQKIPPAASASGSGTVSLVLFGAGASVEYKALSTPVLTDNNEIKVLADPNARAGRTPAGRCHQHRFQ